MLLQTNSYIVPKEKRSEHARLMRRFRQALGKLGCDMFEIYEQVGANWNGNDANGRYVQIMRFRDRKHQVAVQNAERTDPVAQALIAEFCEMVNFPYQQQQGFFAVGFYNSVLPVTFGRATPEVEDTSEDFSAEIAGATAATESAMPESSESHTPESAAAQEPIHEMIEGQIMEVSSEPIGEAQHQADLSANAPMEISETELPGDLDIAEIEEAIHETPLLSAMEFDAEATELELAHPNEIAANGDPLEIVESVEEFSHEPTVEEHALSEDELLGELNSASHEPISTNGTHSHAQSDPSADTDYGGTAHTEHAEHTDEQSESEPQDGNNATNGTEESQHVTEPTAETTERSRDRFSLFRRRPKNG